MKYGFYLSGLNNSGVSVVTCRLANYLGEKHSVDIIIDGPIDVDADFFHKYENVNFVISKSNANTQEVNSPNIKNKKLLAYLKIIVKPIFGRFCWEVTRAFKERYRNYKVTGYDVFFVSCLSGKFRFALNNNKKINYVIHNKKSVQLKSNNILGDFLDKLFFKAACSKKNMVAVSESVKEDIVEFLNIRNNQVSVIYNPLVVLEPDIYLCDVEDYVITIGRLSGQKRFDRAIAAFSEFKRLTNNDTQLYLVGKGELESTLVEQAKESGFEKDIKFLGHREDVLELISKASLVLISSDYEGFSTVAVESILLNTLVVASPSDSLKEISLMCPDGVKLASDMSAQALCHVLISNYENGLTLSNEVCKELKSMVSPKTCIKSYEELVLNGRCKKNF